MGLVWLTNAWEDYLYWQEMDKQAGLCSKRHTASYFAVPIGNSEPITAAIFTFLLTFQGAAQGIGKIGLSNIKPG